jgi:hypothetical protein
MLSKIDQICRENVKLCYDIEYILIDDFFDHGLFDKSHNEFFLSNYTITDNSLEHHFSLSYHPLMGVLRENEKLILTAINTTWNETCLENKCSASILPADNIFPIHIDTHWETVPIRGVLYLDNICGTTFHSDITGSDPIEIGGKSNQLLLFKVSDNSFHSVGLNKKEKKDRFSISMMFDRIKN